MKNVRKLAAALLCLALLFALAACGSFEQRMVKAAAKMEKLESYHMDLDMDLSLAISLMGQSTDMDMFFRTASDVRKEPLQMRSSVTTEMFGESAEVLTYVFAGEKEGSYDAWVSIDGGESWGSRTLDADELKQEINLDGGLSWAADFLRESAKTFTEAGKEEINGSQATRYDGVIEGEAVKQAVEASGVLDSMGEALPVDLSGVFDSFGGTIPVSLWVDDGSGMLVRYDMDMTEAFASVWDSVVDQLMNDAVEGLGGIAELGVKAELKKLTVSAKLSDFDAIGEIVLPEAAKAA